MPGKKKNPFAIALSVKGGEVEALKMPNKKKNVKKKRKK